MIKVTAIRCAKCGDILYSRARHDFHWCSCETVSIDGGFEYIKINGDLKNFLNTFSIKTDSTKIDLYNDWNNEVDNFGKISIEDQISSNQLLKIKFIKRSYIQKLFKKHLFKCSCGKKFKSKLLSNLIKCSNCGFIDDIRIMNGLTIIL